MKTKLILCAPFALLMASCTPTHMSQMVPESRDTEFGGVQVQGFNTGSVITYGKNYKTGYMETANVTVFKDSTIDNTAKLAHAAGSLAGGAGSVMSGYGAIKYADAHEDYARAAADGALADRTNIRVEGSSASASGGAGGASSSSAASNSKSNSRSRSNADANAEAKATNKNRNRGRGDRGHDDDPWWDNGGHDDDPWWDNGNDDHPWWDENDPDPVWNGGNMMGGGPGD